MEEKQLAHKMEELALSKLKESKVISIKEYRKLQAKLTKGSILLVHKQEEDFQQIENQLFSNGYHIHESTNSTDLEIYLSSNWVDIIIIDFSIKWINGIELSHWIREENKICSTPIIFLSDSLEKNIIKDAFDAGATDYLARPIDLEKLLKTVDTLMELSFKP